MWATANVLHGGTSQNTAFVKTIRVKNEYTVFSKFFSPADLIDLYSHINLLALEMDIETAAHHLCKL